MFAVAKATLPQGCEAGGGVWNPDGFSEEDYTPIPRNGDAEDETYWAGQLKNVKNNEDDEADAC